ncbi:hypothetical protein J7I93_14945 [Bacillus sp. ISL-47]|nr:hypothetical protein [Bacillus sp. ISL-47]MBT2689487.1 hypothetical protein [Bacillus sp. ISL-47]MBT2708305.1 hypothetical protein [Pseudomonas sp. ISL-84]
MKETHLLHFYRLDLREIMEILQRQKKKEKPLPASLSFWLFSQTLLFT